MKNLRENCLELAMNNALQMGFPWSTLDKEEKKELLMEAELAILRQENHKNNEILKEAKEALEHCVAVFRSMADRGHYPEELLHDEQRNDGEKLFMGKQGFMFANSLVKKIEDVQK